jgi:hypothetical protein
VCKKGLSFSEDNYGKGEGRCVECSLLVKFILMRLPCGYDERSGSISLRDTRRCRIWL